jgi:mRNA interferase MazF
MTDYDFGDVVLVPFPFTDQTTTKKRPAVVVSSAAYNSERPDIVLIAVTSRKGQTTQCL